MFLKHLDFHFICAPIFILFVPLSLCNLCTYPHVIFAPIFISFVPLSSSNLCLNLHLIYASIFTEFMPLSSSNLCPYLHLICVLSWPTYILSLIKFFPSFSPNLRSRLHPAYAFIEPILLQS